MNRSYRRIGNHRSAHGSWPTRRDGLLQYLAGESIGPGINQPVALTKKTLVIASAALVCAALFAQRQPKASDVIKLSESSCDFGKTKQGSGKLHFHTYQCQPGASVDQIGRLSVKGLSRGRIENAHFAG